MKIDHNVLSSLLTDIQTNKPRWKHDVFSRGNKYVCNDSSL